MSTLSRRRLFGGILIRFAGGFLWQSKHWQVRVHRTRHEMPVETGP